MQVLADVVLIEAECRQFNVDYGRLFAFAERNGIRPVEIMPLGERRAAFDAAYRRRARDTRGDRLCGALAEERDDRSRACSGRADARGIAGSPRAPLSAKRRRMAFTPAAGTL